jgi:hypothetical protein
MQRKGSILVAVLIVLFIISLSAAAGVYYLYQKEYSQNIKLQGQISELENRQRQTTTQLDESKKIAAELELKLQEAKTQISSLAGELNAEKTAHAETSSRLDQLNSDLSGQKSLREDLENRLDQVQKDSQQIKEEIKIIQQQKLALEEKIKNLEEGAANVELGKVVVSPEAGQPASQSAVVLPDVATQQVNDLPVRTAKAAKKDSQLTATGQEGKVLIVNKEFNFVVINLGSKDRVTVGDEFLVSRSGNPIGEIKVEKVHEFMSAAGFSPQLRNSIKENDKVTQKIR